MGPHATPLLEIWAFQNTGIPGAAKSRDDGFHSYSLRGSHRVSSIRTAALTGLASSTSKQWFSSSPQGYGSCRRVFLLVCWLGKCTRKGSPERNDNRSLQGLFPHAACFRHPQTSTGCLVLSEFQYRSLISHTNVRRAWPTEIQALRQLP